MSTCKACGGEIVWKQIGGRWHGQNPDGSDHWDLCSKRKWEQVKATGIRFEEKWASGYFGSIHGTKFDRQSSKPIKGKKYRPTGLCRRCVPPWEACPSCPDEFQRAA